MCATYKEAHFVCSRKKVPENGDWRSASNYVAKRYLSPVQSSVYLDDVRLQMEAKLWSEAFNKQNPPKKVIRSFTVVLLSLKYPRGFTSPTSRLSAS